MHKVINILIIAILSVIFIGLVLFGVNFAKNALFQDDNVTKNKEVKKDKKENVEANNTKESNTNNQSTSENNASTETPNTDVSQVSNTQENNTQQTYSNEINTTQSPANQEEPPGKNNFNQAAVDKSLDEAAQNLDQFDADGDGKIEDSERTTTTDLLESQGRLTISNDDNEEE
ncbi:hypothetical protein MT340_000260 [Staphylococcus sp. NRL 16/872]|uniref:hypothetical protein n=1 Tax=Staphylococcus sp. NRL 16/872 TaxID=2930131 RepID=UPI001FB4DE25|nr:MULTISPECIES: hypothetical protein [unclassified Staphylococcus]MCJ1655216.1 hypothetical protein [Staphylococcus sp. NRL 21/187]MCJ1661050.1 hypothetical protein [Staphylococcus sp. NRL 18/288]MCJ1666948.1 hypothetical protein [Staphylococcus sp. NRL 19/737]WEN69420.1 hypothetical protein MT340_000260 [Staphylococcus sp. NRL 16/872]